MWGRLHQTRRLNRLKRLEINAIAETSSRGFSLVEVLVSMMITTTFLMITLQLMLSAAVLRAKATEYNDAYNWIQEDFEQILTKAQSYEIQAQPFSTLCNPTNASNGLAANFVGDAEEGLGGASVNLGQRSFGGKTFSLRRIADYQNTLEPNRLISLKYVISNVDGNQTILELDTRVIVYSAFNCPFVDS